MLFCTDPLEIKDSPTVSAELEAMVPTVGEERTVPTEFGKLKISKYQLANGNIGFALKIKGDPENGDKLYITLTPEGELDYRQGAALQHNNVKGRFTRRAVSIDRIVETAYGQLELELATC